MTISEALSFVRYLRPDTVSDEMLIEWLSILDGRVAREIMKDNSFEGYDSEVDRDTKLLIPFPYQDIYLRWLEAKICFKNEEIISYENQITMFNADWENYANYYAKNHTSGTTHFQYF